MVSKKVIVSSAAGFHVQPANKLCNFALGFSSSVTFRKGNTEGNCKSILSVLASGIRYGDEIELICQGEDEEEALRRISVGIENNMEFPA